MIRGGTRSGRIALVGVCVLGALAVAAPATVVAQPAVEEYSLDIPSGGSGSSDSSGTPSSGAGVPGTPTSSSGEPGSGGGGGGGGGGNGSGDADASGRDGKNAGAQGGGGLQLGELHDGGPSALGTSSRSAPEVVADTLLDGAMWPLLVALVAITGFGAWRVLRGRGILRKYAG